MKPFASGDAIHGRHDPTRASAHPDAHLAVAAGAGADAAAHRRLLRPLPPPGQPRHAGPRGCRQRTGSAAPGRPAPGAALPAGDCRPTNARRPRLTSRQRPPWHPCSPCRRPQAAPDLELAANAPDTTGKGVTALPQLSETLPLTPAGDAAAKEVPRATAEREAVYDAVVQRFTLFDLGRLRGWRAARRRSTSRRSAPTRSRRWWRGLNRSATLDASCPVMAISGKLDTLLAACNDLELIAQVRDSVGKGVGLTPYAAYLTAIKQSCTDAAEEAARPPQACACRSWWPRLGRRIPATRRKAANALGLAGADAKAAVPALVEALKATPTRRCAAPPPAPWPRSARPPYRPCSGPPSRARIARCAPGLPALGESRPADPQPRAPSSPALKDPDKEVRAGRRVRAWPAWATGPCRRCARRRRRRTPAPRWPWGRSARPRSTPPCPT